MSELIVGVLLKCMLGLFFVLLFGLVFFVLLIVFGIYGVIM